MAYIPNSNSVVAFQSSASQLKVEASILGVVPVIGNLSVLGTVPVTQATTPWIVNGSGSVATVIIGGSIAASFTPPANQSVSGAVSVSNFPTVQDISGSVVARLQSTNASVITVSQASIAVNIIAGSIAASFTPPANQSVSGTVQTDVRGSVATVIIGGSIAASFTPPANQSVSGTVQTDVRGSVAVAIISGSIAATFTPPANQSVSGAVSVSNFPAVQDISGSVVARLQSTNASVIAVSQGSVATVIIGGSIAASFTPPANQSVSGTVQSEQIGTRITSVISANPSSMLVGASIIGLPPVNVTNTNLNVGGSVVAFQGTIPWANTNVGSIITVGQSSIAVAIIAGSIAATFVPPANQSVSGTVDASQINAWRVSVISSTPSSMLVGSSMIGVGPVNVLSWGGAGAPPGGNGTVTTSTPRVAIATDSQGPTSVVAFQGGTRITSITGTVVIQSIVGTYAEDAAHTSGDAGLFVLGVRNDTMASVASADLDYTFQAVGPVGEVLVANSPITKWISGTASMLGGTPVTGSLVPIIAAQGSSIFTYITSLQIANASANNAWITLLGGTNSVVGYTVAPANGGSNIYFPNALKTNANAIFSASISAVASVYVSAQGFIAKI